MVRKPGALRGLRAHPVRLFAAHALAARQPRKPAAARQGLARRGRTLVPAQGARQRSRASGGADVRAAAVARDGHCQSYRGLADGDLFGRRRHAQRFSPRPLWRAGAGRGRAVVYRDDVRFARRPDHAGLHRHVERRPGNCVETHRRFRPCQQRREILPPARPFGTEGIDQGRLGRI